MSASAEGRRCDLWLAAQRSRKVDDALHDVVDLLVARASQNVEGEPLDLARVLGSRLTGPGPVAHLHVAHDADSRPATRRRPQLSQGRRLSCGQASVVSATDASNRSAAISRASSLRSASTSAIRY